MGKILVLTARCYEDAGANGICAYNVKQALYLKNKYTYILGYTHNLESADNHNNKNNDYCFYYEKKKKASSRVKKLITPSIDLNLVNKYFEYSERIIKEKKIDTVICFYFPLEVLTVGKLIKKKYSNIKVIDYEVDSSTDVSSYTSVFGPIYKQAYVRYLRKIYRIFDYVFVLKCHEDHVKKVYGKQLGNKMILIDTPMLKEVKAEINEDDLINFVYTGFLNKDYYSPKPFIELLKNNLDKKNWRLHVYSRGNGTISISEAERNDNRIINHEYVSQDKLTDIYNKANIFLSIDNVLKVKSIPSKFFEYIGVGKPVIHFAQKGSALAKDYVSKYELGLNVDANNVAMANKEINSFINNNYNKKVDYPTVKSIYFMNEPEYSAKRILGAVTK